MIQNKFNNDLHNITKFNQDIKIFQNVLDYSLNDYDSFKIYLKNNFSTLWDNLTKNMSISDPKIHSYLLWNLSIIYRPETEIAL